MLKSGASETFLSGLGNIFAFSSMFVITFMIPQIGEANQLKKVLITNAEIVMKYIHTAVLNIFFKTFPPVYSHISIMIWGYGASETFLSGLGNIFAFSSMFVIFKCC